MDFSINEGTLVVTAGSGDSFETAIVLKRIPKTLSASGAQQILLEQMFGRQRDQWTRVNSELVTRGPRVFDVVTICVATREQRVYFDVSELLRAVSVAGSNRG